MKQLAASVCVRLLAGVLVVGALAACGSPTTTAPSDDSSPPAVPPAQLIALEPAGPAPDTSAEQLAQWSGWVRERFLDAELSSERREELDGLLREVHVLDLTPAFLNTLNGLDMAAADDVARGTALVDWWYREQGGLTTVFLDVSGGELSARAASNRVLAAQSWSRWWTRKTTSKDSFERLRRRVDELLAELAALGISKRRVVPEPD